MLKAARLPALPLLLLAFGCASGGLGTSGVSLDQEWQLGDQLAAQVAQQVQLVNDPAAVAYVRMVGERIHAVTPLADRPFDFEIVRDSSVNAFSLPGGHVYVNTGVIAQATRVDELAAVLGHEISHIVHRDAIRQIEQQNEIDTISSIVLGQSSGLAQLAGELVAGGVIARFSRADEKAADDLGLQLMAQAGYDPHGMLDFYRKLVALDQSRPDAVARFFQDHPGTQDRVRDIEGRLKRMAMQSGIVDDPRYQIIRRQVV